MLVATTALVLVATSPLTARVTKTVPPQSGFGVVAPMKAGRPERVAFHATAAAGLVPNLPKGWGGET